MELSPPQSLPVEPDPPPDFFEESKDSADSLVELDAPPDFFVELTPPQRLPVKPDPSPNLFEGPSPPPAPDYGAGPSFGPICGTEYAPASICGAKPSILATGGDELPPGIMGGSWSYINY